jgi:NAD(P)H-hydrate epimerase
VAIGPGFGTDGAARAAVERVLATFHGTILVDADALTCFAGSPEAFAAARAVILTPHPGEAGRLLGVTAAEIERDRFAAAREIARRSRAVVVLKGAHTIVCAPDRAPRINPAATSALATAGSGDVLSGTIVAVGASLDPFDAATAGVFIHGASGEAWARAHADRGMLAHDIADGLPAAIGALAAEHARCPV